MSRHIRTIDPAIRKLNNDSKSGKLLLTNINNRTVLFLLQNNALVSAQVIPSERSAKIGEIYVGKVKNILANTNSCFVEIADDQICYLPLSEADHAFLLNRKINHSYNQTSENSPIKLLVQGDELPVQIVRSAMKTKPAAVTAMLELQSEYFVIKIGKNGLGISEKIDKKKRTEMKDLLKPYWDTIVSANSDLPGFFVICRTKSQELTEEELINKFHDQMRSFADIFHQAAHRTCYSCLLSTESALINMIRQIPEYEYDEIKTDIPEIYEELNKFHISKNISFYQDQTFSLKNLYGLQTKLDNACIPKVWMKSGANLVIEQTECLTTIDVNSGKNIRGKLSEEIIYQINVEAAKEAAAQIRLRNLSGIIIIDFINMKSCEREHELLDLLKELTAKDPITTKVVDMTPLGLVEITRKKINMSLKEQFK